MISKQELVDGIRFAGRRASAAAHYTQDWSFQLGHQWTSGDAFRHLAANAGILASAYPLLGQEALSAMDREQLAQMNSQAIDEWRDKPQEEVLQAIIAGHNATADFVETLDEQDLATVIRLGDYEMPKAEIIAQIWINHAFAHAYEASARWPIL
jgi:hypothetical protein